MSLYRLQASRTLRTVIGCLINLVLGHAMAACGFDAYFLWR